MNAPDTGPLPDAPSRRLVLGASLAGVAGLLTACGGGSTAAPADSPSGGSPDDSPGSSSATADSPSSSAAGGLVKTADVPVGSGVILKDEKLVVTQPAKGQFKGFSAVCTHQQCIVNTVKGDTIFCPCHGSRYSTKDGSVKGGPAPAPLKEVSVKVEGTEVVQA